MTNVHDIAATVSADYATLGSSRADLGLEASPTASGNPYEAALMLLFSRHFRLNDIGANDSFFSLGGDSLQAETLMTEIERDFGVVLPVSAILDAQTPRQLGSLIKKATDGETREGCLVALRRDGKGTPVFCVHAYIGDVAYARAFAAVLNPTRPAYGLRALGLQDEEVPIATLEGVAARYISEIKTVQASGPYLLAGACVGAIVASEMAQQLRGAGEDVSGLVMIDPVPHLHLSPWLASSAVVTSLYRVRAAFRLVRSQLIARAGLARTGKQRRHLVYKSLQAATALYRPRPYDGSALLVHTEEYRDGLLGEDARFPRFFPCLETAQSGRNHGAALDRSLQLTGNIVSAYFDKVAAIRN